MRSEMQRRRLRATERSRPIAPLDTSGTRREPMCEDMNALILSRLYSDYISILNTVLI